VKITNSLIAGGFLITWQQQSSSFAAQIVIWILGMFVQSYTLRTRKVHHNGGMKMLVLQDLTVQR
jgi:hypothetical protein